MKVLDVGKIRAEIARQQISHNYLAQQLDQSVGNVSQKLNGKVKITPNELYIIAMITKQPLEHFYSEEVENESKGEE